MCLCVLCLVLSFFHSCPGYFQCINASVYIPDLSPISIKTTNLCSWEMPVSLIFWNFHDTLFPLCFLLIVLLTKQTLNLDKLANFMDPWPYYFFRWGKGTDAALMPSKLQEKTILGFYFSLFFFTLGDCLYANTNYNFGLALMRDLYILWRSAIVGFIAFMHIDDHLKPSGSLKSAWEG